MYPHTMITRSVQLLAAIALVTSASLPLQAQRLEDGKLLFEAKARDSKQLRNQLLRGEVSADPKDKSHQEAADIAAKAVTYPLKWDTPAPPSLEAGKMDKIVGFF